MLNVKTLRSQLGCMLLLANVCQEFFSYLERAVSRLAFCRIVVGNYLNFRNDQTTRVFCIGCINALIDLLNGSVQVKLYVGVCVIHAEKPGDNRRPLVVPIKTKAEQDTTGACNVLASIVGEFLDVRSVALFVCWLTLRVTRRLQAAPLRNRIKGSSEEGHVDSGRVGGWCPPAC